MDVEFRGEIWFWRGPAPFYFITVPDAECQVLKEEWTFASYGWGMIPVTATIGTSRWKTSLFPKDGRYVLPIKAAVRQAENIDDGDVPRVKMEIRVS